MGSSFQDLNRTGKKVYRNLLKAVMKQIGKEEHNSHFTDFIKQEFKKNVNSENPQKLKLAHDYTIYLNSVHHHKIPPPTPTPNQAWKTPTTATPTTDITHPNPPPIHYCPISKAQLQKVRKIFQGDPEIWAAFTGKFPRSSIGVGAEPGSDSASQRESPVENP
ncbi:Uncharacterized protein Fot_11155 [Forsythia ovata]|uniref:Uncharacterized protein n=1 Tax=Forsythia ovata TaxID=205694 RepID=A0ABD1WJL0_9LAMI